MKTQMTITVDPHVLEAIERDRGRIKRSTYVNAVLQLIFSSELGYLDEVKLLIADEGRATVIPDFLQEHLEASLSAELERRGLK